MVGLTFFINLPMEIATRNSNVAIFNTVIRLIKANDVIEIIFMVFAILS